MVFCHFYKRKKNLLFPVCFSALKCPSKLGLSQKVQFLMGREAKNENNKVASPRGVPIYLNKGNSVLKFLDMKINLSNFNYTHFFVEVVDCPPS